MFLVYDYQQRVVYKAEVSIFFTTVYKPEFHVICLQGLFDTLIYKYTQFSTNKSTGIFSEVVTTICILKKITCSIAYE